MIIWKEVHEFLMCRRCGGVKLKLELPILYHLFTTITAICLLTGAINDKAELETQIRDLVEELANERIELDRYKTLLENEKGKVLELQQLHKAEDKSELEQLVENTRYEFNNSTFLKQRTLTTFSALSFAVVSTFAVPVFSPWICYKLLFVYYTRDKEFIFGDYSFFLCMECSLRSSKRGFQSNHQI